MLLSLFFLYSSDAGSSVSLSDRRCGSGGGGCSLRESDRVSSLVGHSGVPLEEQIEFLHQQARRGVTIDAVAGGPLVPGLIPSVGGCPGCDRIRPDRSGPLEEGGDSLDQDKVVSIFALPRFTNARQAWEWVEGFKGRFCTHSQKSFCRGVAALGRQHGVATARFLDYGGYTVPPYFLTLADLLLHMQAQGERDITPDQRRVYTFLFGRDIFDISRDDHVALALSPSNLRLPYITHPGLANETFRAIRAQIQELHRLFFVQVRTGERPTTEQVVIGRLNGICTVSYFAAAAHSFSPKTRDPFDPNAHVAHDVFHAENFIRHVVNAMEQWIWDQICKDMFRQDFNLKEYVPNIIQEAKRRWHALMTEILRVMELEKRKSTNIYPELVAALCHVLHESPHLFFRKAGSVLLDHYNDLELMLRAALEVWARHTTYSHYAGDDVAAGHAHDFIPSDFRTGAVSLTDGDLIRYYAKPYLGLSPIDTSVQVTVVSRGPKVIGFSKYNPRIDMNPSVHYMPTAFFERREAFDYWAILSGTELGRRLPKPTPEYICNIERLNQYLKDQNFVVGRCFWKIWNLFRSIPVSPPPGLDCVLRTDFYGLYSTMLATGALRDVQISIPRPVAASIFGDLIRFLHCWSSHLEPRAYHPLMVMRVLLSREDATSRMKLLLEGRL